MKSNVKFIVQVAVFSIASGIAVGCLLKLVELYDTPKEPRLYTVHFDGIDYQDLEQIRSTTQYSVYRTKAGKRITFKGIFYEVEQ